MNKKMNGRLSLWPEADSKLRFFHRVDLYKDLNDGVKKYRGDDTAVYALSMMTCQKLEYFAKRIDEDNPLSWSYALGVFGKELVSCPIVSKPLEVYVDELLRLDDLFLIIHYPREVSDNPLSILLGDVKWRHHVKILYRKNLFDTKYGDVRKLTDFNEYFVKWIYRVMPK